MTLHEVLAKIETGSLPRVLFVHGPETHWHDQIYRALKKRNSEDTLAEFNWSVFHGSKDFDLGPLLAELGVVAWGDGHKIVVLRDAELIPAAKMDELVSWLEQNPDSNSVTIFSNKVDKRLKYVKTLRQIGIEIDCQPIQGDQAVRYVLDLCTEQGKSMKRGTAELFLETVGTELLTIQNELEKLLALSGDREEITPDDIKSISCLAPGEIADRIIFQMTDFIVQKKRTEALNVLNMLMVAGEPALRILPVIERQLRLLLAAKTATANLDDVARQMGETNSYPLKKTKEHTKSYELQEIFRGFEAVLHADSELKLGVPGDQVLTDLIIKLT